MPGTAVLAPFRKAGPPRRRGVWGSTVPPIPVAPATPNTPSPADAATLSYTLLSWLSAGATKFDIYVDTVTPPVTRVVPKYVGTSYVPTLLPSTHYYWQIVAFNDGGSASGPIWSFTTPAATAVLFSLAGTLITSHARWGSLSIRDALNAQANTGNLLLDTTAPTVGQAILIGLGTLDATALLFGGEIQHVGESYVGTPDAASWPVTLIDHTFAVNKRRPFGTWVDVSATTIAQYLVATFAPGFTATGIQDSLPEISIVFDGQADFMACMGQLATAISTATAKGRTDVTYAKDVILSNRPDTTAPDPIDVSHPPLNNPSPITFSTDLSQVRTRVYGKGHGETLLSDVAVSQVILPIADAVMFNPDGGQAIVGTTADGAQSDIVTYESTQLGGEGTLVGPGASPSSAPGATVGTGTGIEAGDHDSAVVFVTAAGKSLPGPRVTVTNAPLPYSSMALGTAAGAAYGSTGLTVNGNYLYAYSFREISTGRESALSDARAINVGPSPGYVYFQLEPYVDTPPAGFDRRWYRTTDGGSTYKLVTAGTAYFLGQEQPDSGFTYFYDNCADAALGAAHVTSVGGSIDYDVPLGGSGVTSREIYRTPLGSAQLKLAFTIADNVTTLHTDATPDASLGANVPTSDTSGLTQPSGQVLAGSTSMIVAGTSAFAAAGGWASIGSQTLRYTGITAGALTGIPASGIGSLTATVSYNTTILATPALVGVNHWNGVSRAIAKGSKVCVWVQRDDLAAQAALGALELDANGLPTDGIREATISDERRGEDSLIAACDADLAIYSRPIVSANYYTRDIKSKSGRTVPIDLTNGFFDNRFFDPAFFDGTAWGLVGDFVIQSVDISFTGPAAYPLYHVTAASAAFTLTDLLRKVVSAG